MEITFENTVFCTVD